MSARKGNIQNIINLSYSHYEHFTSVFPRYHCDCRRYLGTHRDPDLLNQILIQLNQGLQELYYSGYTHYDLKPDSLFLMVDSLRMILIDFDRTIMNSTS